MIFCPYLVRDINFEPDAIQPCCNTRALQSVPRFPFSGGDVNMAAYSRHIEKTLALLQEGKICTTCPEITEIDTEGKIPALNILFHTVSFNMHRWLCNCKCIYCTYHKKKLSTYSILPAVKSLHSQGVLHTDCMFSWGGGEPTMLHEFEEAAAFIDDIGFKQYIHTNALQYSPIIAALLKKRSVGVNISLDSGSKETYRTVKGVDGFAHVTNTISKYIAASQNNHDVTIKYIIFAENNSQEEIEKFFALCQCLGIKNVQFSFDFRESNTGNLSDKTLHAAILFLGLANALEIACAPFFVDDTVVKMMEDAASTY